MYDDIYFIKVGCKRSFNFVWCCGSISCQTSHRRWCASFKLPRDFLVLKYKSVVIGLLLPGGLTLCIHDLFIPQHISFSFKCKLKGIELELLDVLVNVLLCIFNFILRNGMLVKGIDIVMYLFNKFMLVGFIVPDIGFPTSYSTITYVLKSSRLTYESLGFMEVVIPDFSYVMDILGGIFVNMFSNIDATSSLQLFDSFGVKHGILCYSFFHSFCEPTHVRVRIMLVQEFVPIAVFVQLFVYGGM